MNLQRNNNPFEKQTDTSRKVEQVQDTTTLKRSLTIIIALSMVGILVISVATSFLLYHIYLNRLFPLPINSPNFDISYDFDDDYFVAIANDNARYVVEVSLDAPQIRRKGSGVMFKFEQVFGGVQAYIITNYHVIEGFQSDNNISIRLYGSSGFSLPGSITVLGGDAFNDIAVLKFKETLPSNYGDGITLPNYISVQNDRVSIEYSFERDGTLDNDVPVMGRRVLALGNALGIGLSACEGIISMPINYIDKTDNGTAYTNTVMQITAPINPGNSGGALFDVSGNIIGINTYRVRAFEGNQYVDNISYAVPIELALASAYNIVRNNERTNAAFVQTRAEAMTPFNLGLNLSYELKILGVQETSVLTLNRRNPADIVFTWGANNDPSTEIPEDSWRPDVEIINAVQSFAGVDFNSDQFLALPLFAKRQLLLKAESLVYGYSRHGNGAPLTLVQNGKTFTLTDMRLQ